MKIGIGICTYNRLSLLQRCLESLQKTSTPYQILVASDGSPDGTEAWLKTTQYPWTTGPNNGVAANKNRLLDGLSQCDFIILLEDDILVQNGQWLDWYIKTSQESHFEHFSYQNKYRLRSSLAFPTTHVLQSRGTTGQLMLMTKAVLHKCGGFNQAYGRYGYEHLEYSKRIHFAFGYNDVFYDSLEGNRCMMAPRAICTLDDPEKPNNKLLYKHFCRHYQRAFEKFRYCEYKNHG